jgi:hypothetical protein
LSLVDILQCVPVLDSEKIRVMHNLICNHKHFTDAIRGLAIKQYMGKTQGVTTRCRLSWLTHSAFVYEPKCGGRGELGGGVSANEYRCTVHRCPHKLWRSNSIFNLSSRYYTHSTDTGENFYKMYTSLANFLNVFLAVKL